MNEGPRHLLRPAYPHLGSLYVPPPPSRTRPLVCPFSDLERNLTCLLGDFLLGTSSSGELCPSEIQQEPPLDPRLLTDLTEPDDRTTMLKGGEGGERGEFDGPDTGGLLV